jgi:hypothetical protein
MKYLFVGKRKFREYKEEVSGYVLVLTDNVDEEVSFSRFLRGSFIIPINSYIYFSKIKGEELYLETFQATASSINKRLTSSKRHFKEITEYKFQYEYPDVHKAVEQQVIIISLGLQCDTNT